MVACIKAVTIHHHHFMVHFAFLLHFFFKQTMQHTLTQYYTKIQKIACRLVLFNYKLYNFQVIYSTYYVNKWERNPYSDMELWWKGDLKGNVCVLEICVVQGICCTLINTLGKQAIKTVHKLFWSSVSHVHS